MSTIRFYAPSTPKPAFPAWGVSIVFHLTAIALMAMAIRPWPRGAAATGNQSISIVLNQSTDNGDLREGDGGHGEQPQPLHDDLEPPALLAAPEPATAIEPPLAYDKPVSPIKLATASTATSATAPHSAAAAGNGVGRSGTPGGNGAAKVSVFGVEGKGSRFVYLFDRSASMEGAPLAAAKRQLLQSMRSLSNIHQFCITFFNTETQSFDGQAGNGRAAFATDRNKQLAANFVGGITADGGTDRLVALREAMAHSPDVIFFLTDADDPMPASELGEIERLNRRVQAAICVIEFGDTPEPSPGNFLMKLAQMSGGRYGYVDTATLRR